MRQSLGRQSLAKDCIRSHNAHLAKHTLGLNMPAWVSTSFTAWYCNILCNFVKVSNEVAILIPFIFCVERTLFYISKAWFYREFFPKGYSFKIEYLNTKKIMPKEALLKRKKNISAFYLCFRIYRLVQQILLWTRFIKILF